MATTAFLKDRDADEGSEAAPAKRSKAKAAVKPETARLNLLLPAKSIERLDRLKEKTEATSYAEVIRNAIRLYEGIIAEYEKGNKVQVIDADGKPTSLSIF